MSNQPRDDARSQEPIVYQRYTRLEIQLAVATTLLVAVMVIILNVVNFIGFQRSIRLGFQDRLRDLAGVIASQVDGSLHASLESNDQQFSSQYNAIRGSLVAFQEAAPEINNIYTLRLQGTDLVYVVDANPIPAAISEVVPQTSQFARTLFDNITAPIADDQFYTSDQGTFIYGYAPVYNALGELDAILAVQMNAELVYSRERTILGILGLSALPILLIVGGLSLVYGRNLAQPIIQLTSAARQYTMGELSQRIQPARGWSQQAYDMGNTFNAMADRLANLVATLESRVAARTQEANRRSDYVQAASEVAAATSSMMERDRLIRQVAELIRDRFKLYYVGLFLLDESGEWAVLRAGTGDAGQRMLSRGHRIQVGQGMIGWSIANAQARISLEAVEDRVRLASSELPLTRSEAAIPLRSRERVLGALTVQSTEPNAFDQAILLTFQTMADQIAVALDNARLLAESQSALEAVQRSYQQVTQRGWVELLRASNMARAYRADVQGVAPAELDALTVPGSHADSSGRQVQIPVKVRGLEMGRIVANKPANRGEWRSDEIELMQDIVNQVSTALENARLYSETQRSAERERILSEITSVVRNAASVDAILQNAVRQLASALNVPQAAIRLHTMGDDRQAEPVQSFPDEPAAPRSSAPEPEQSSPDSPDELPAPVAEPDTAADTTPDA